MTQLGIAVLKLFNGENESTRIGSLSTGPNHETVAEIRVKGSAS